MKYAFKRFRLLTNLISGLGLIILGVLLSFYFPFPKIKVIQWVTFGLGIINIVNFMLEYTRKYIEITPNYIKKCAFPAKKINIQEINAIEEGGNIIRFKSDKTTLRVIKSSLRKKDIANFKKEVEELRGKI